MVCPTPSPQHIHPALWRGSQWSAARQPCLPAGHAPLAAELPGGGWPLGSLTELLPQRPGIGELRLLRPALARLAPQRPVVLIQPPYVPNQAAWRHWGLQDHPLLWLRPRTAADALWAAEQVLKNGHCGALLLWQHPIALPALRRLHLAAQGGDMLCLLVRPPQAGALASAAPLRVALAPAAGGLLARVLKRRGPPCEKTLFIDLDTRLPGLAGPLPHAPLDLPAPAPADAGRLPHALA
ncbi:translesion DNA synthesis-associated protein ImuA [Orrella sp. JC864]|uniref:translesion DNA synthesis-associated protein ImuA n=1 Tax=Orrella sp. JC864 TaxID=3120298 RepID=UPI003009CE99